jgi:trimethylamine-N-oxide reductase (cytochrome c)
MQLYLLAMQGWGKPGVHQFTGFANTMGGMMIANAPRVPAAGPEEAQNKITAQIGAEFGKRYTEVDRNRQFIPADYFYDAMFNPPVYWYYYNDPLFKRKYPLDDHSEIHMIWSEGTCFTGNRINGFRNSEGYCSPKIETNICQTMFLEDSVLYSDIILPIIQQYEIPNGIWSVTGAYTSLHLQNKRIVEPLGEAKSDFEAILEVAKKFGLYDDLTEGGKSMINL